MNQCTGGKEKVPFENFNERNIKSFNLDFKTANVTASSEARRLFERLARDTWLRLQASILLNVSQGEETITDINLLEMKLSGIKGIKVWKCPKQEEPLLAIDWQWFIGNNAIGWRSYMVQAKK